MNCINLNVTARDKWSLVAGVPIWTESERPSVIVGRKYEVGNVFQTFDRTVGTLVPLSDALIQKTEAISLGRLIRAKFVDSPGDGTMDVAELTDTSLNGEDVLLSLCVEGYRELDLELSSLANVDLLLDTDATIYGSYVTDRARAVLLRLSPGAKFVINYGVPKKLVSTVQGDKWWQPSYWFPYETSTWVIEYSQFEVSYDGVEVDCQLNANQSS